MEKVYVNVDYQVLVGGAIKPVLIYWHDGRAFDIRKTLHCCTSEAEYIHSSDTLPGLWAKP